MTAFNIDRPLWGRGGWGEAECEGCRRRG